MPPAPMYPLDPAGEMPENWPGECQFDKVDGELTGEESSLIECPADACVRAVALGGIMS